MEEVREPCAPTARRRRDRGEHRVGLEGFGQHVCGGEEAAAAGGVMVISGMSPPIGPSG
jgi:hypothetical protein